uniref:Uncharacterized protein LOC111107611 n=1 Tax=Crassostrea virginica TaxID=6565 RepID=A0A8B8B7A2_CRAVI|nr:uncharacterized protein LOC111107611 [Crassostrea virginica]
MATVIIAIDGSDFAENAFKCYVDNLHKPDYKVVLLHVMENLMHVKDMSPGRIVELQREAMQKAAALKDKYTQMAASLGIQAEVRIEKNTKPSHGIVEIATQEKAKFIVTGCRGMGLVRRTILGSVSDFILHHAHCPVFIYKKE